jgi:hypothetical protein
VASLTSLTSARADEDEVTLIGSEVLNDPVPVFLIPL